MTKIKKLTKIISSPFLFILVIFIVFVILLLVFSGQLILSQSFYIGPLSIHYYGLIMALAVGLAWILARRRAQKFGIDVKTADDIIFYIILGGFIGARLYHVFSSTNYYWQHPIDILKVWNGGLSIFGAVLGGLVAIYIYQRIITPPSPPFNRGGKWVMNWLTPSLIVGQIIGRFGNLFNYEAFGYPTNLPWKMFVPWQFRPEQYQEINFFHPWFLYEQIGLIAIFFIISRLGKQEKRYLFIYYVLLYNILRFALEFLRIDSVFFGNLRLNSISSALLVFLAIVLLITRKKHEKSA